MVINYNNPIGRLPGNTGGSKKKSNHRLGVLTHTFRVVLRVRKRKRLYILFCKCTSEHLIVFVLYCHNKVINKFDGT